VRASTIREESIQEQEECQWILQRRKRRNLDNISLDTCPNTWSSILRRKRKNSNDVRIYKVEDTMLETENFRLQRGIIKQSR
jgi:hypothetical protein